MNIRVQAMRDSACVATAIAIAMFVALGAVAFQAMAGDRGVDAAANPTTATNAHRGVSTRAADAPATARPAASLGLDASTAPREVDWQTSPLDLDLRGMNGEQYTFLCPQPSRVAGSGPYTDDSSICAAAVHAGAIHPKTGGTVTIEIRPGQKTFLGSAQNYITSTTYDHAWSGGFVVLANDIAGSKSAPTN